MRGRDAALRYTQDWLDTFENFAVVPEELLDLGDDRVLAVLRLEGRARQSGLESEFRYASVYRLRAGKLVEVREYADRGEALDAVGLKE